MSEIRENLKSILRKVADNLDEDNGNSYLSENEMKFLLDTIQEVTSPYVSTYQAQRIAKVKKRSTFYNKIKKGELPKGKHIQGFKEAHFSLYELEKATKKKGQIQK